MSADTFKPEQHPRAADGRFANKPWQVKPQSPREVKIRAAAGGFAVSGLWALSEGALLIGAIFSVASASLLAWGGYKGAKKRRKRKRAGVAKTATGTKVTRFGTVRLTTAQDIEAFTKLQQTRWARRDETWGRRKAAVAKVLPHKTPVA